MTENVERRSLMPFELRQDGEAVVVVGHAAVFNQEVSIGDYFREVIRPGAFVNAIGRDDVPFLIEHEGLPLARTRSGTLKLQEDSIGLRIEAELDIEDPDVKRIIPKMKRGDLDKMSFAFRAVRQEWFEPEDDIPLRILHEVDLGDVAIVTFPAYDGTDIALRSLTAKREKEKESERKRDNFAAARLRLKLSKKLDLRCR